MSVVIRPVNRRQFVTGSLGALAARPVFAASSALQNADLDPDRVALLADTHIDADPKRFIYGTKWPGSPVKEEQHEGVNMADCLERVVRDILSVRPLPAHAVVNGDCARTNGSEGEYREFVRLVQPLREAGISLHVTIGNHDNRKRLWNVIPELKNVAHERHVGSVQLPKAEIALLDSDFGSLGAGQLAWLRERLEDAEKRQVPLLGFLHYNPYPRAGIRPSKGLAPDESASFLKLISSHKRAKALFFGHTHDWAVEQWIDVHMVNQPPVGYYFGRGKAYGWLDMKLDAHGAAIQLRCVEPDHPRHGERHALRWR